jgi:hypothetical protein
MEVPDFSPQRTQRTTEFPDIDPQSVFAQKRRVLQLESHSNRPDPIPTCESCNPVQNVFWLFLCGPLWPSVVHAFPVLYWVETISMAITMAITISMPSPQ